MIPLIPVLLTDKTTIRYGTEPITNMPFGLATEFVFILFPRQPRKPKLPSYQDIILEGKLWARKLEHQIWNEPIEANILAHRLHIKEKAAYARKLRSET